jgi:hypothetical protein
MVALRHTIKGYTPRLAYKRVPVEIKIFETIAVATYTPLCFHCNHWKAFVLWKKTNYKKEQLQIDINPDIDCGVKTGSHNEIKVD